MGTSAICIFDTQRMNFLFLCIPVSTESSKVKEFTNNVKRTKTCFLVNQLFIRRINSCKPLASQQHTVGARDTKLGSRIHWGEKVTMLSTQSGGLGLLSLRYNAIICSTFPGGARIFCRKHMAGLTSLHVLLSFDAKFAMFP